MARPPGARRGRAPAARPPAAPRRRVRRRRRSRRPCRARRLHRHREHVLQLGDERGAAGERGDDEAAQGDLTELAIEVVERALQLERDALDDQVARRRGAVLGEGAGADVEVAQRVELALAREGEQAAVIVEGEEREAALVLLVEAGEIALRDLGDVDCGQAHPGLVERAHARADALAARRDGDDLCRPADARAIARDRHRVEDGVFGGEIDRVLDRPAQRLLGLGGRHRRRRHLDDVIGAGVERRRAAQAGDADRLAHAQEVVGVAAAALDLAQQRDAGTAPAANDVSDAHALGLQVDGEPAGARGSLKHRQERGGCGEGQGVAGMLVSGAAAGRSKSAAFGDHPQAADVPRRSLADR